MTSKRNIWVSFFVLSLFILSAPGLADCQLKETTSLNFKGGISTSQVLIEIISSTT